MYLLNADLAKLYGVPTKVLNQAVKRNSDKFPEDFMFHLTLNEANASSGLRSRNVTLKQGQHIKYAPYAFTEHGAIMAATLLNSPIAVQMSVFVVRAFVKIRSFLLERKELMQELAQLEKKLTERLDIHEIAIVDVLKRLMAILDPPPPPPPPPPQPPKGPIGFHR